MFDTEQTDDSHFEQFNQIRLNEIFFDFDTFASERVKNFPAMLTRGDRAVYFWAAKNARCSGAIVDAGCFVGGTTSALAQGLTQNPIYRHRPEAQRPTIKVYDLFQIDAQYILDHLREQHPDIPVEAGGTFRHVFEHNTNAFKEMIDLRPGDVMTAGYKDGEEIEILGVDLCKALPVTDFVVREFFPRLMPGALVMQQDFIHEFHPHIHLSMLLLADHFEKFVELEWGGSVAYRCIRPITPDTVVSRFGKDSAWYSDVPSNARLLRGLAEEMVFGCNAWTILLTLGWYYYQNGCLAEARAAYHEARERYPDFEPLADTAKALGGA